MSLIAQKISGCYRRVLVFMFVSIILCVGIGLILYNQVGGTDGLRYWTATRALNGTEKLILANRPDGISQENVEIQFSIVRESIKKQQIDLRSLYDVIKSFQEKFHNPGLSAAKVKPSTPEVETFLRDLNQTIILDE